MIQWPDIETRLAQERLLTLGAFHEDGRTCVLVGPDEPAGFWSHFQASAEARDGQSHPLDRWSKRVIEAAATAMDARAVFPFGGPPYHPFYSWALKTGRIHQSPIRLLVHDKAGLWVSFRGALFFDHPIDPPAPPAAPCLACADQPCMTACPVGALGPDGYDVPACKDHLNGPAGAECMGPGCRARSACPVSKNWGRVDAQSAFHMASFNPR